MKRLLVVALVFSVLQSAKVKSRTLSNRLASWLLSPQLRANLRIEHSRAQRTRHLRLSWQAGQRQLQSRRTHLNQLRPTLQSRLQPARRSRRQLLNRQRLQSRRLLLNQLQRRYCRLHHQYRRLRRLFHQRQRLNLHHRLKRRGLSSYRWLVGVRA